MVVMRHVNVGKSGGEGASSVQASPAGAKNNSSVTSSGSAASKPSKVLKLKAIPLDVSQKKQPDGISSTVVK